MKLSTKTVFGFGCALLTLGGTLTATRPAAASKEGARNTAIVLGAATIFEALRGKKTEAIVLGAGTAYAAKKYEDERKADRNKDNWDYNRDYRTNRSNRDHRNDRDYENDYRTGNQPYRTGDNQDFRHVTGRRDDPTCRDNDGRSGHDNRNTRPTPPRRLTRGGW